MGIEAYLLLGHQRWQMFQEILPLIAETASEAATRASVRRAMVSVAWDFRAADKVATIRPKFGVHPGNSGLLSNAAA
jgi:hypothetical protein